MLRLNLNYSFALWFNTRSWRRTNLVLTRQFNLIKMVTDTSLFPQFLFVLEPQPFFSVPSLASRGTTCWLATKNGKKDYVVKDSWRLSERSSEGALLNHAKSLGVQGIAEYVGHEDIRVNGSVDNIFNDVLKGIDHGDNVSDWILRDLDDSPLQTSTKHQSDTLNTQTSTDSTSVTENVPGQISNILNTSGKAKSVQKQSLPMGSPDLPSKSQKNTANLQDRIHTRLITRCGKSIEEFASIEQLLEALRDAIRGHQSLYVTGKILHRDISINNVMIATGERPDGFKGFLIDLDMAMSTDLAGDRKVGHRRTGTLEFMSLNWNEPKRRNMEPTPIDCWSRPDYNDAFKMKTHLMTNLRRFEEGLNGVTTGMGSLKQLLRNLRRLIRPLDTELELGPPETDAEKLYREVINAFDRAITDERKSNDGARKTRSGMVYKH
ncbi:hypothetical protein RUND412_003795 [Rhizina undulata]